MEKLIEEIGKVVPFKDDTAVGDLVLIVTHDPQLLIYALVSSIERDSTKRDEWWHVELTMCTIPLQKTVWTLRTAQMTGQEIFTMGGEKRFLKAVDPDHAPPVLPRQPKPAAEKKTGLKRVK